MFSLLADKFYFQMHKGLSGFNYMVSISDSERTIEIYGEEHNTVMPHPHIYSKIVEELPKRKDITVLVEHSTHPMLCQLTKDDKPKFTEQIKRSGSEYVFFHTINDEKINTICVDNRIMFGYLPAFQEIMNFRALDQLEDTVPTHENIELIKMLIFQYSEMLTILNTNEEYYEPLLDLYKVYLEVLSEQLVIAQNIFKFSNLLEFDIVENTSLKEHKINNYTILIRALSAIADNFKKISSLTVDVNIVKIISETPGDVMLFCGSNHAIRLSKLFFEGQVDAIYDSNVKMVDDFSSQDIKGANIYPISSPIDEEIIEYLTK
jgi:hypothetical protein